MRRLRLAASVSCLAAGVMVLAGPTVPAAQKPHNKVVSDDPVDFTPHILDGRVRAIALVGKKVIVGGEFSKVREAGTHRAMQRRNLLAFHRKTGKIDRDFTPRMDGPVRALARGPRGSVVAGGSFRTVNGHATHGLARLRVADGARVASFAATKLEGPRPYVSDLAVHRGRLYVAGRFTAVNGAERGGLARLQVKTGRLDKGFEIRPGKPRAGALKVLSLALSPGGSKLAIAGTFTEVNGRPRQQIALVDAAADKPRLARWATRAYTDACRPQVFATYLRGIDFAPDGSYFVVVTTGGTAGPRLMCDSAARFETGASGTDVRPTWVNRTGGDSLYEVAVTPAAVYVGGHQRWMDNPHGKDSPGPGAKSRPGIAALDPRTGEATAWNPTRTRGHGVEALAAGKRGLWVGSDTDRLGREYHGRIGMFPVRG